MHLPHQLAAMKLGCRWQGAPRAVSRRVATVMPPAAYSRIMGTPRVEGHNDQIGDCVETAACNAVQTEMARVGIAGPQISNDLAVSLYSQITGYTALNPASDRGTDPNALFGWWRQNPIAGYRLAQVTPIDPQSEADIRHVVSSAGGIFLVLALGLAQQNQLVWTAAGTPGSWGYHAVWADDYDGALTTCTSWGEAKPMARGFFAAGFVVAAYALELAKKAGAGG
jgi:hypothetical protein